MSQLLGAILRAILVMLLVAMPALMLPGTEDADYAAALACLVLGGLILAEYAATYPGLIEFRDAPPYNRIRAIAAFAVLFFLSVVAGQPSGNEATLGLILTAIGEPIAAALEFPFSPVHLMMLEAGRGDAELIGYLRPMLGIGVAIGLLSVGAFALVLRLTGWPLGRGRLNLWTNLPLFDPTGVDDVAERLRKSAAINYSFAFLTPFLVPLMIDLGGSTLPMASVAEMQVLVWMVSLWTLAPVCFAMRAMALGRIVTMIEAQRRAAGAAPAGSPALS